MKKSIILLLLISLIFSLSACGDSFQQGMKDGMEGKTQESTVDSEAETTPEENLEVGAEQEGVQNESPDLGGETEAEDEESSKETSKIETEQEETGTEQEETEIEESGSIDLPKVSDLTYNGENVIDVTVKDMKEYDYIKDVYIQIDESEKQINIAVQIPSSTDEDTAKMAGEDIARYLAACASWSDNSYSAPGSEDIGGIYETYDLLIYIDDANHNFDIYGAKVTSANKITW